MIQATAIEKTQKDIKELERKARKLAPKESAVLFRVKTYQIHDVDKID